LGNLLSAVLGFVVRLGLLLAGLVFFASLLVAGLLVLLVWLLRALWASLTGRPVSPWTFQINRLATWDRFYRRGTSGQRRQSTSATDDVVDAPSRDVSDVTDVEPKRISG
jgi:hypothetical protein